VKPTKRYTRIANTYGMWGALRTLNEAFLRTLNEAFLRTLNEDGAVRLDERNQHKGSLRFETGKAREVCQTNISMT